MRAAFTVAATLFAVCAAGAAEIRQFDLRTTERLGNQLVEASKRADRGAKTPAKKRAKQTAVAAVEGKLYDGVSYGYVVLDDPRGSGFLVYALARAKRKGDVITGGHFRVSVSSDGALAERVDLLSQLIHQSKPDAGNTLAGIGTSQIEGKLPAETWIYSSELYRLPMYVAVIADGSIWAVANGRIVRADGKGPKNHLGILNERAPNVYE
jgi:hypothetical protein